MNEREYKRNAYKTLISSKRKEYFDMLQRYYEENVLLKRHYIQGETYKQIAEDYRVTPETIRRKTDIALADVKMLLAENGCFDRALISEDEKPEYFYFRKVIKRKGITALHIADEVDIYTIAKYLNILPKHIQRKIEKDKQMVQERLDRYGIVAKNNNVVNLYIDIFDENMKDFSRIPDELIGYVYDKLTVVPELLYSQIHYPESPTSMKYWGKYTQDEKDRVDNKVFALKNATKKRMAKINDSKKGFKENKDRNNNVVSEINMK